MLMLKRFSWVTGLAMIVVVGFYFFHPRQKAARVSGSPQITTHSAAGTVPGSSAGATNNLRAAAANTNTNEAVARQFDLAVNPYAASLRGPGKSHRAWNPNFITTLQSATNGDPIQFELTEGRQAVGTVRSTQFQDGKLSYVSGVLKQPETGKFFFLVPPAGGKAGKAVGVIEFPASRTAYRIEPTGPNGDPELWQRRLDEVLCLGMPPAKAEAAATNEVMNAPPLRPDADATIAPAYNTNLNGVAVVSLQSNPGSKAVLLLDFFGGYTPTWGGVPYSVPAAANNATIKDLWKRVAEDYMPFNINVTTDIKVFQAAPASSRQRCCFTDTPITAAGVAYVGSWNWGNDTPCWSVYTTGKDGAEVGAHEPGHTLGLSHETQEIPDGSGGTTHVEYDEGHGSGATGWAPIMGVGYYQPVSTWSKGEYQYAGNLQDQLNIIATANNNVTYRADDTGDTLATARPLEIYPDDSAYAEGVIERTGDTDAFQFTTTGGEVALMASPVGDWADLAVTATLADSTDTIIASNDPQDVLTAAINTVLSAGTYTFRVTGSGRLDPVTTGFSSYASLGYYSIAGYVAGARLPDRFEVTEHPANGTEVGTVVAADPGSSLAYAIMSGNTGGAFNIDASGILRVNNSAAIDYTTLAANSSLAVQFELSVNITNLDDAALSELNRRVVIAVQSISNSYPIAVTGMNAGVIVPYNATVATPHATGFDIANNYCFYEAGLFSNPQVSGSGGAQGLPASGMFVSRYDGSTFRFGTYGGTNALMLGRTYPASGTLTFAEPRAYNSLTFIAASVNGGGVGTCFVTFTNGTRSQNFNFNDQDWFNTTANVALNGFGRIQLGQPTLSTEDSGFTNPNFYQSTINLAAIGLNLPVASITFNNPAIGGNQNSAVFAVSGLPMADQVSITGNPQSITNVLPAQSGTLTVVAMGTPPLACQWYQGNPGSGTPVADATNFSLTFTPVQANNAGTYYVIVTNSISSATSAAASVVVYREPQIVQQPLPASSALFAGQKITFTITANAASPVNYYWRFNGTNIPNATAAAFTMNNLQVTNTGSYSCLVSNAYGMAASSAALLAVVASNYPYAQLVINDHPVSYWRLDETSGSVAHDYVSTNNGVYINAILNQPGNNLVDTHRATRFGATINSYVGAIPLDFGTTNYTSNTNGQFSVECWVNGGPQTTDAGIIAKGTGGGGEQFDLDCGGANHAFRFFVRDNGGTAQLASGNVVPDNQWHHLVGVCNQTNGTVSLYVDGVLNASGTIGTAAGILDSAQPVTFGSRQSGSGNFDNQFAGRMEEVAIYHYALSAAQVQSHYAAAINRAPAFVSNPFSMSEASVAQPYAATIAGSAIDPNGDAVVYGKVSGPAWLSVASNGTLSGTPAVADAGTNIFSVSGTDPGGLSATAGMTIVVASPIAASLSLQGGTLQLNWSGGIGPYQVEMTTNLASPNWTIIATDLATPALLVTPTNEAAFYRIIGQ
jgi:hypothetical protein